MNSEKAPDLTRRNGTIRRSRAPKYAPLAGRRIVAPLIAAGERRRSVARMATSAAIERAPLIYEM
jgi:hypothetical protein